MEVRSPYRYSKGYLGLTLPEKQFLELPSSIEIEGEALLKKTEFHITLMCVAEVSARISDTTDVSVEHVERKLLEIFLECSARHPVVMGKFLNEFRLVRKDDRTTIVIRCEMLNIEPFFAECERFYNRIIERQPMHLTLYTKTLNVGIGIHTVASMEECPKVDLPILQGIRVFTQLSYNEH